MTTYPTDELGTEIYSTATVGGIIDCFLSGKDVYDYLGVYDSVVRERVFNHVADSLGVEYTTIYEMWMRSVNVSA